MTRGGLWMRFRSRGGRDRVIIRPSNLSQDGVEASFLDNGNR
jgi:hypothetical protein